MKQHDFVLIDRSGSMSSLWEEALTSVNSYAKKLADQNVDTEITVAFFDGSNGLDFEVARQCRPETFRKLTNEDAMPRGMTPLSDAVGKIVAMAEAGTYDKVAIIIMTDGQENASREYTVQTAKQALDRCRKRDWAVTFLGANFDNVSQAASYGVNLRGTVCSTAQNMSDTFATLGTKRGFYASASAGAGSMDFTPDEQLEAKTDKNTTITPPVKKKK